MPTNPFKQRSRSSSSNREERTMEMETPPPLLQNPPPLTVREPPPALQQQLHLHDIPQLQLRTTPALPPGAQSLEHEEIITTDDPMSTYGGLPLAEKTNAIIKVHETGHVYGVERGRRLDRYPTENETKAINATGTIPKEENDYEAIERVQLTENEQLRKTIKLLQQQVISLQSNQSKLQDLQQHQTTNIKGLQQDVLIQGHDLEAATQDISSMDRDINEMKEVSTRYTSKSSSRRVSRENSRRNSPTRETLRSTQRKLRDIQERQEENQEEEEEFPETDEPETEAAKHTTLTLGKIMSNRSIWSVLRDLKDTELDQYPSWLETFEDDWNAFGLPRKHLAAAMLRKMPNRLRLAARTEQISNLKDLKTFLYVNIFSGKNYTFMKNTYKEKNKMAHDDHDFAKVLENIKVLQVPTLMSLQPELQKLPKETKKTLFDKEVLDLFEYAIPYTVKAQATLRGMEKSWEDLFKSCMQTASARLVSQQGKQQQAQKPNTTPKKIGLLTTTETQRKGQNNKWCHYHKVTTHSTEECRAKPQAPQSFEPTTQKKFIVAKDGQRNYCGFCVPMAAQLPTKVCSHCWRHSDPGVAIPMDNCFKCRHQNRMKKREENPPPQSQESDNDTA